MEENKYLQALEKIDCYQFNEKIWLANNFELYKQTLNWPNNLPPIDRTNLAKGTLRQKFNSTYKEILSEFEYELNNETKTLKIKTKEQARTANTVYKLWLGLCRLGKSMFFPRSFFV